MSDHRTTRPTERLIVGCFAVAALAAVALGVVYAAGGQPQAEGALLAVAFAALGIGLVLWANRLLPQGPYTEPRHPLQSADADRALFEHDLERRGRGRRRLLGGALAAALAALGAAFAFPIRSLGPGPGKSLLRTGWGKGVRVVGVDGRPVRAVDVPLDGLVTVFPEGHAGSADAQAVLVRVRPALLRPPRAGRETWTPEGLVAYSKVCTHAGCPVGLYQADTHQLLCPCHQSAFDVLAAAEPVFGPAAWPLPQLPLTIGDDGVLRAGGDFSEPVGPGWWRT